MHQDGDKLGFMDVGNGRRHDTALGAWKKRRLVFDGNDVLFSGSGKLQLDMLYVLRFGERKHVACLPTLVVLLNGASGFSNQRDFYTVLDSHERMLAFLRGGVTGIRLQL